MIWKLGGNRHLGADEPTALGALIHLRRTGLGLHSMFINILSDWYSFLRLVSTTKRVPARSTVCLTWRLESRKCICTCLALSAMLITQSRRWLWKERTGNKLSSQPIPTGVTKNEVKHLSSDLDRKDWTFVGLWLRERSCLLLEPRQTC